MIRGLRGGSWLNDPNNLRASNRNRHVPGPRHYNYGFRLVCVIDGEAPSEGEEMTTFGERVLAGMKLVLVPPGKFLMGSPEGVGDDDEHPQHEVEFEKPFWFGQTHVTNRQYREFCEETGRPLPGRINDEDFNDPDHPVVEVNWFDCTAFAEWYSAKASKELGREVVAQLPSEEEYEYAVRGPESLTYPWGNNEPTHELACYWKPGRRGPDKVGSHPKGASWCGVLDGVGLVWMWLRDVFDSQAYAKKVAARK